MYVPVLEEQNGQYEFVFHDVCWLLLQERFQGNPVPLDRLIEVLNSVPLIEVGPWVNDNHDIWIDRVYMLEHGYHGLAFFDDQGYYPWESRLVGIWRLVSDERYCCRSL